MPQNNVFNFSPSITFGLPIIFWRSFLFRFNCFLELLQSSSNHWLYFLYFLPLLSLEKLTFLNDCCEIVIHIFLNSSTASSTEILSFISLCFKHCSLLFSSSDLKQISILVLLSVVGINLQLKFSLSSSVILLPGVPFSGMQFAFDNIFGSPKVE